jgi:hypothetical protein
VEVTKLEGFGIAVEIVPGVGAEPRRLEPHDVPIGMTEPGQWSRRAASH